MGLIGTRARVGVVGGVHRDARSIKLARRSEGPQDFCEGRLGALRHHVVLPPKLQVIPVNSGATVFPEIITMRLGALALRHGIKSSASRAPKDVRGPAELNAILRLVTCSKLWFCFAHIAVASVVACLPKHRVASCDSGSRC